MAKGQMVPDFKADVVKGCAPVLVNFTDLTTGHPTSWFWDLGNGNTSVRQNPGTLYYNPGTYTIRLIVTNAAGVDSVIKSSFIVISNDPDINFSADKLTGCAPLSVQFVDKSNAGFGNITKWEWDFGDGATSKVQSPAHTYTFESDATVILKVTNSTGCSKVLRKPAFLHVNPSPNADFTAGSSVSCKPPAMVTFTNTSAGAFVSSNWSFGDRTSATDTNATHSYTRAGNYPVKLVVTNQYGCADSVTKPTVIGAVSPDFSKPDTVCEGSSVHFINTSLPATAAASWQFGDGTSSADVSPVKVYANTGNFSVKMVNNFGACVDSVTKQIFVRPGSPVDFSFASAPSGCSIPVNVAFKAAASGTSSYLWNFGDSSTSAGTNPTHTYTVAGNYSVSLTVSQSNGCTVTKTKTNFVSVIPAKINGFNDFPYHGCVPHTQDFSADITSPEPVASYLWNFGDGTTSTLAKPSHTYTVSGSYSVSLLITTVNGCTDTLTYPAAIVTGERPTAAFTAAPRSACAYQLVEFSDSSRGTVNNWFWQFGDNFTSYEANPGHAYRDTGFFKVTLIVGNYYCFDTLEMPNYVYIKPPVARFDVVYTCDTPMVRTFTNRSVGAETFNWKFGDGTTSTSPNPVHSFPSPGTYNTSLHVTNGGCYDDVFYIVQIIDEKPDFITTNNATCRKNISTFTATNINTVNVASYVWDFGDSTGKVTADVPGISHTYSISGVYSPSLTVIDKLGCERTVQKPFITTINGPIAAFSNPEGTCINARVSFGDQSRPYSSFPVNYWMIDYGDGTVDSSSAAPSFIHQYSTAGSYNILEVIRDAYGCIDSLYKPNGITITNPISAFSVSDSIGCGNSPIQFTDNSTGAIVDYAWNFGDGKVSDEQNPIHAFAAEGSYTISFVVKDEYGCSDTSVVSKSLVIGNAKAIFSMSDSIIKCPPGQISFVSNSVYSTGLTWSFDDGSFSMMPDPSHYFLTAREYNVKLVVKGYGSCVDSATKKVVVQGPAGSFTYSTVSKCAPATIDFIATVSNNSSRVWDFGDGTTVHTSDLTVSHEYTTVKKYVPKLLLTDTALNCSVTLIGSDTITVPGVNTYIKTLPPAFCDSAAVQFADSSVVQADVVSSYLWHFGDGTTSTLQNPLHTFTKPGLYPVRLTVSTQGGCVDSADGASVKIVSSPVISIAGNTKICSGETALFAGDIQSDTSSVTWSWDFNNGAVSSLQNPAAQKYAAAGDYIIKALVINSTGCRDTASALLSVLPLPAISAGADSIICLGQSIILKAAGGQNYQWQPNPSLSCTSCGDPVASPILPSVSYVLSGTSAAGCKNADTVTISVVQPFIIRATLYDTLCKGQSTRLSVAGADRFMWSPQAGISNVNSSSPVARPDTSTTYRVVGFDHLGCFSDTAYVPVVVYPVPVINILVDNMTIAAGNKVTLTTSCSPDVTGWSWIPAEGLSCTHCAIPVATPASAVTYHATATNQGGCKAEDQVTIQLFCTAGNLYLPNTFSPNNDGSNDVFYPRGRGIQAVKMLQVFNRWGNLIFQKSNFSINDQQSGWNGTFNGLPANADVYAYQIEVICNDGEAFTFKGDISLIR